MLPKNIAFVDIETTGGSLTRDRIIEIGIIRVENGQEVSRYQTLINPQTYLPQEIERLTNITGDMLELAPTFSSVKQDILELLDGCVFAAHNARFDYGFLKQECKRENISFSQRTLCTVKLAKALFPSMRHHNLDSVIETFNIPCEHRHRAFDDAYVLWEFYKRAQEHVDHDQFRKAIDSITKRPSLPAGLTEADLAQLPETPGVYIFYGNEGIPLYVGKSKNIHDRVLSHFSQDHADGKEMRIAQQVQTIETIQTYGELGALLKEADLVKKLQPLYNRQLRRYRTLYCLRRVENEHGYTTVSVVPWDEQVLGTQDTIVGFFKTSRQAKQCLESQAAKANLCKKLLGLERATGPCFGYQLGTCNGACVGEEKAAVYNMRFTAAFSHTMLQTWPFTGPVAIVEKDMVTNTGEAHIVNLWCYMGSVSWQDELSLESVYTSEIVKGFNTSEATANPLQFDIDTYNILRRYMKSSRNITQLPSSFP